jgi:cell wall-associated NlpC family hydrolase
VARTAWLRTDQSDPARVFRISFGTRLPVVGEDGRWVRVEMPDGVVRRVLRSAAVLHQPGEPALPASTSSLMSTATSFVGLPYLWSGLSGFGLDCSGLTWLDYRVHGITIPRDALPQSRRGTPVAHPGPGDLMFYATAGKVHHVSMYLGNGRMVQAPHTGARVQVVATSLPVYSSEYAGARRYYSP